MGIQLQEKPNWLMEALSCIEDKDGYDSQISLERASAYGMTEVELETMLKPWKECHQLIREELMLTVKRCPRLVYYLEAPAYAMEGSIIRRTTRDFDRYWGNTSTDEEIMEEVNQFYQNDLLSKEMEINFNGREIRNLIDVVEALKEIDFPDDYKMQLIRFYSEAVDVIKEIKQIRPECERVCQKQFKILKKQYDEFIQTMKSYPSLADVIKQIESIDVLDIDAMDVVIIPNVLYFNQISLYGTARQKEDTDTVCLYIYYGIGVMKIQELKKENRFLDRDILEQLKALADATRLKILMSLTEEDTYLQELARRVSLTPATVSHHLGILLNADFVKIEANLGQRKMHYSVNREKLRAFGEQIKALGGEV